MAACPLNTNSHYHARSNSLPSKPHSLILQCNEHLARLGATKAASSTASSFNYQLSGLQDLHVCIQNLVQLSHTQEILVQERQEKWVDELLDGSLKLLDVCSAAKDSLLHTKECARELQSIMRRRRGGEVEITAKARRYLTSRKVVKKAIFKALGNLKGVVNKCKLSSNKDYHTVVLVSLLKDVEAATLYVFESLLNFVSGTAQSKSSNWSLVSKLMITKRVGCRQVVDENEFAKVDAALQLFLYHMTNKSGNINQLKNQLENLESCIQDFVEGLESLFRRFIKIRVAQLNILNH